jgi:hypothetical protein
VSKLARGLGAENTRAAVSDAGCYAYGLVWLFGTLPEVPLRMVERAKGGHMNPKQGTFFRKYAGGRCQSESRAAMAVQPGVRGSPALMLPALPTLPRYAGSAHMFVWLVLPHGILHRSANPRAQ